MKSLKLYSKILKKKLACEAILKAHHAQVMLEIKRSGGQAICDGVEYHLTKKIDTKFTPELEAELKGLRDMIDLKKSDAKRLNQIKETVKETFDAAIPKSTREEMLAEVPEYKKYFGV